MQAPFPQAPAVGAFQTSSLPILSRKRPRDQEPAQWSQKKFACTQCQKTFESRNKLDTHFRIHTGEKPFPCTTCGKKFRQRTHLRDHQRIHTGEKPFECPHCGKRCNNRSNFNKHFRVHTGEKPYGCAECGKRFSQKSNLTKHIKIHTAEKNHNCVTCGKTFRRASHLKQHIKQHTMPNKMLSSYRQGKNHVCNQCRHAFSTSAQLRRHYRVHTGEKPFPCEICGRRFTQKGSLTRHIRTHEEKKEKARIQARGTGTLAVSPQSTGIFGAGNMSAINTLSHNGLNGEVIPPVLGGPVVDGAQVDGKDDLMSTLATLQARLEKQIAEAQQGISPKQTNPGRLSPPSSVPLVSPAPPPVPDARNVGIFDSNAMEKKEGGDTFTEESLQELQRQQEELEAQLRAAQAGFERASSDEQTSSNQVVPVMSQGGENGGAVADANVVPGGGNVVNFDEVQKQLEIQLQQAQTQLDSQMQEVNGFRPDQASIVVPSTHNPPPNLSSSPLITALPLNLTRSEPENSSSSQGQFGSVSMNDGKSLDQSHGGATNLLANQMLHTSNFTEVNNGADGSFGLDNVGAEMPSVPEAQSCADIEAPIASQAAGIGVEGQDAAALEAQIKALQAEINQTMASAGLGRSIL